MEQKGKVSGRLTREEAERLAEQVCEIKGCRSFLNQRMPEEEMGEFKMGDRTIAFVESALQIAR